MVPFGPLSPKVMGRIVSKFAAELAAGLAERKVELLLTEAAQKRLAEAGYDPVFGARPLARVMREQVEDVLAGELLFGKLKNGGKVTIDAASGEKRDGAASEGTSGQLVFHYEIPEAKAPRKRKKDA